MKTLKQLAIEALQIQDACNLCALAQRFAKLQIELGEHVSGTNERNNHPVTRLWLDKMNSLANIQDLGNESHRQRIGDAYEWAFELSEEL